MRKEECLALGCLIIYLQDQCEGSDLSSCKSRLRHLLFLLCLYQKNFWEEKEQHSVRYYRRHNYRPYHCPGSWFIGFLHFFWYDSWSIWEGCLHILVLAWCLRVRLLFWGGWFLDVVLNWFYWRCRSSWWDGYFDDLPDEAKDDVFSFFEDELGLDIDYHTSDCFSWFDCEVQILNFLVDNFGIDVDCCWRNGWDLTEDCVVDQFAG